MTYMEISNSWMALQNDLSEELVGGLKTQLVYNISSNGYCIEYQKVLMNNLVLLHKISPTALQL